MIGFLVTRWQSINASYWFYPALLSVAAFLLSLATVSLDRSGWADWLLEAGWYEPARPQGASNMLTVISGSMIGVASTVFSITIAAVSYASGTYGPRVLTNFMEDRGNQFSLATFIATFVFAITTLRTVREADEQAISALDAASGAAGFVPQFSLLVAYALMGLSIAVLVYFLHHIPASIRINSVLQSIGERLLNDIGSNFPNDAKGETHQEAPQGRAVVARRTGYIQHIDFQRLDRIAQKVGGHIKLGVRTGDFVYNDVRLIYWDADDDLDDLRDEEVSACFTLGGLRTPVQDIHFLMDELVEIGLRALSPGINDPFTAITALHWLGAATSELAKRDLVRSIGGKDDTGSDRLVLRNDNFAHFVARGFGTMRSGVATSPAAALVAMEVIADSAATISDETRQAILRQEGERLILQAREALAGPDLDLVEARYAKFEKATAA
ncbi:DUF2254 domain-containing protein [Porphyrobacter sp. AAP60]|uniref:DUF2254 domain-containing protein n=1 Tax=Porphyrobacter sp. AAP60 TaxID=1523423 RepID=UPI0006B88DAB|nr:DUF2254 domain-containing protein [Porphyrobacter sp. AAP60]KPF62940.1 hypothetical protein IP79_11700 [Porphyrobacter sp. AAP60]